MVTAAEPVFLSVSVCRLFEPATTSPKFTFAALAVSVPAAAELEGDLVAGEPACVKPTQPEMDRSAKARTGSANSEICPRWAVVS